MTQNTNNKKAKEQLNPFVKAYLYSYLIVLLIIIVLHMDSPFLSDEILFTFAIPFILPVIPFFTFVIDALYLFAIVIYGITLFLLFKLPNKFSRHKTLIFTLILLFAHLVGVFSAVLIIPHFVA